jgi:mannose-6-phosphate isomerase-like protein (cupin superfamily)
MKRTLFLVGAACLVAFAAGPVFERWSAEDVQKHFNDLKGKMVAGSASDIVGTWGQHQVILARRDASGMAEWHEIQADILIVKSGGGSIKIGGKILDGKPTDPGEIRGTTIEGAETVPFKPGDVIHIPAKTPHQILLETGQVVEYYAIKARE